TPDRETAESRAVRVFCPEWHHARPTGPPGVDALSAHRPKTSGPLRHALVHDFTQGGALVSVERGQNGGISRQIEVPDAEFQVILRFFRTRDFRARPDAHFDRRFDDV